MTINSKRILVAAAGFLALLAAGFAAMHFLKAPPADLDLARSKLSATGLYRVAIEPEAPEFRRNEMHSWLATVTEADGAAVEEAEIAVDGGMPQHGHGLPTSPQATAYLGEGRYRIEGVRFNMDGWWELKFAISSAAGTDQVVFNLSF